jgi:hypothetical protein
MLKQGLSSDTTFYPRWFLLYSTFKISNLNNREVWALADR